MTMTNDELLKDLQPFSFDNKNFRFVEFMPMAQALKAWELHESLPMEGKMTLTVIDVKNVNKKILEELNVWDKINDKNKSVIDKPENNIPEPKEKAPKVIKQKSDGTGKRGRKPNPLNIGIPRQIVCTKCGNTINVNPNTVREKDEKMNISIDEYVETFVCNACLGIKRGRPKKND